MVQRRPTQQVITDILLARQGNGANKTDVVYDSKLNFNSIRPYLKKLSADGLLEVVPGQVPIYRTTEKGLKALEYLKTLGELMPSFVMEDA